MGLDLGISGFLTTTPGVGGVIKASPEDFLVEEASSPPPPASDGRFAIATVRVRNWETNRLVREFARALRISRRRIGFAGTKDKRAVSVRLFSFEDIRLEALKAIRLKDVEVLDAYVAAAALEIGDLRGNRFAILVRDLAVPGESAAPIVEETARQIRAHRGFPNFFGIQRFGSVRPITHLVGRHIVRGEFASAVDTYVANPIPGEDEASFAVRRDLAETGDVRRALREYPRAYSFEKAILNHLSEYPDDHIGALQRLPFNLLLMFVHAYQSFLFNRIVSERMHRGLPIDEPAVGDLVLPADASGLPDRKRTIDVTCDNLAKVQSRCREGKGWVSGILFGSEPEFAAGEPGQIERDVIGAEGVRPEDFVIPAIPRISSKGTRREILAPVREMDARIEEDVLHLRVELTRGAYATSLVREFTKDF
jgi:tRNA pseudouridine13 synthase